MADRLAGRVKNDNKNLETEKYFNNWPGNCPFNEDIQWAANVAIQYLKKIAPQYKQNSKTGIVVLDLDDTVFFGDFDSVVGVEEMSFKFRQCIKNCRKMGQLCSCKEQDIFILPTNKQIVNVAATAKQLGFKVVMLTARPPESKMASIANLQMFNIPYDALIMNDKDEDPFFKIKIRRQLSSIPNQQVVLTMGDQITDCYLPGGNCCCIKLPDSDSHASYAYIP